jgi:hypothetical protein
MSITREQLDALWAQQKQREADERERIRRAVAASEAPLPEDLAAAVVRYFVTDMHDIMRGHPGYPLVERRNSYRTSLAIMEQCLQDLLAAVDRFESYALSDEFITLDRRDRTGVFEREIQKELFAAANAAVSLVDHARRFVKLHPLPDYEAKRLEAFGSDGLHEFVTGLRVLLHHLHIVDAGWNIHQSISKGTNSATFVLEKAVLQRLLATYRGSFLAAQYRSMRSYVDAQNKVDLRTIFLDYRARMARFHGWMAQQLKSDTLVALRDYDALMKRKQNVDRCMFWNAMLGNWLRNWKEPPDPHKHLAKYLTPEQLADVYSFPRNSKEQVDRVIQYMDADGAADDGIRKQANELFQRSPPA